jgi:hypothetical protein
MHYLQLLQGPSTVSAVPPRLKAQVLFGLHALHIVHAAHVPGSLILMYLRAHDNARQSAGLLHTSQRSHRLGSLQCHCSSMMFHEY